MGQWGSARDALGSAIKAINEAENTELRNKHIEYLRGLCNGLDLVNWDDSQIQKMLEGVEVPDDAKSIIFD